MILPPIGAALSDCASHYNVRLTNGSVITAKDKPKLDKATGMYIFKVATGEKMTVTSARVREISTASSSDASARPFKSGNAR